MTELFAGLSTIQMRLAAGNAIAGTPTQLLDLVGLPIISVTNPAYGATGKGVTDDTAAIQAAIDAAEALGGGTVFFPTGTYLISATLTVNKPIVLLGAGIGEDGERTTTGGLTLLKWSSGVNDVHMIEFKSATANHLSGCGANRLKFNLGGLVGSIKLDRVEESVFENIYAATANGALTTTNILLTNGCRFNEFRNISLAGTNDVLTLHLDGENGVSPGCTQNKFYNITASYGIASGTNNEGALVLEGDVDNNEFYHFQAVNGNVAPSVSSTWGLVLKDGASIHPRFNNFYYWVGSVKAQANSRGNRIFHMTSETSQVDGDAGAIIHYDVVDNTRGGLYETPRLAIKDRYHIDVGHMVIIPGGSPNAAIGALAGTARASNTARYPTVNFPGSASSSENYPRVGFNFRPPIRWGVGSIIAIELDCTTLASVASPNNQVRLNVRANNKVTSTTDATFGHTFDEGFTVTTTETNSWVRKATLTFATPITYTNDQSVVFQLERRQDDAGDLLGAVDFQILSAQVIFEGAPTGGGPSWDFPDIGA